MMDERGKKPHALMISIPYQGHLNPFIYLALKLASKGLTVTFALFEIVHHKLTKAHQSSPNDMDFFAEARRSGLDIRCTTISDGFPLEFDRDLHYLEYWESMVTSFPVLADEFVGKTIQSDPILTPNFLVTDSVCEWPAAIAEKHKLVNVSFWTEPALVFSLLYHLDLLGQNGHFPCPETIEEEINYLPGVESISTKDFMPYLTTSESVKLITEALSMAFTQVKRADFILHNTVYELESETLSALNKYQPHYSIGPVHFSTNLATNIVSKSLWSESDCTQWLGPKPPGSVLYVSFGSLVQTSKQVIEEMAYGLLLSEVSFIWVVRDGIVGSDVTNVLPIGFEDEIKDQGLIVPWCDQIKVLSDPAVGGFLTHCGWNSTLESMWYGVPMICYPINYDQPTNRKLVVDDWKIGVNLCDGKQVCRKKVGDKINNFMSASVVKGFKEEADKVKGILHNAVENDGSSERNFERFIKDLKAKIQETSEIVVEQ